MGYGVLAGALLTAPLVGVMYLIDKLAGLPFVPFALFDWIARVLPGPVITFGIDLMIDGMRLVGLSVADAAKTGEQAGSTTPEPRSEPVPGPGTPGPPGPECVGPTRGRRALPSSIARPVK